MLISDYQKLKELEDTDVYKERCKLNLKLVNDAESMASQYEEMRRKLVGTYIQEYINFSYIEEEENLIYYHYQDWVTGEEFDYTLPLKWLFDPNWKVEAMALVEKEVADKERLLKTFEDERRKQDIDTAKTIAARWPGYVVVKEETCQS